MTAPPRVLFLCTANSARSQMAEGLLREGAGEAVQVDSAGTTPGTLHPVAVEAMAELDIDISAQQPTNVDVLVDEPYDYVITVCGNARETCPVFPGATRMLHWSLPDPALAEGSHEERLSTFRRVRDMLRGHIDDFLPQVLKAPHE